MPLLTNFAFKLTCSIGYVYFTTHVISKTMQYASYSDFKYTVCIIVKYGRPNVYLPVYFGEIYVFSTEATTRTAQLTSPAYKYTLYIMVKYGNVLMFIICVHVANVRL